MRTPVIKKWEDRLAEPTVVHRCVMNCYPKNQPCSDCLPHTIHPDKAAARDAEIGELRNALQSLVLERDALHGAMKEIATRAAYSDCPTIAKAALAAKSTALLMAAPHEPIEGDLLPPIGTKVLLHLARQGEWIEHTVVGYYVWPGLNNREHYRVFVRVVDAHGYSNARMLSEVRAIDAAIAKREGQ